MQITVSNISTAQTLMLDVPPEMTIADLKALIIAELQQPTGAPQPTPGQVSLYHNGKLLSDVNKTLNDGGIRDSDMIVVHTHTPAGASGSGGSGVRRRQQQQQQQEGGGAARGGNSGGNVGGRGMMEPDAEMIRLQVLGDPRLMDELRRTNPEMANAVSDPARFRHVFEMMEQQRRHAEMEKQREIARLDEDPFNPESQARIAELIRQEQVMENLQSALEHNPEAFGRVIMLYIPVEVNGHPIKAFVDSGAQATIMSPDCAEQCGIMRLIDSRFAGIARGVGTAKILGRVHSAQIKIGNLFLACSFTVMEGKGVDLLLGLDMLKRHQAKIDLEKNCLVIGGSEVQFLGEADIPKAQWEIGPEDTVQEPTVEGPGGAKIGGRTGALISGPTSGGLAQPGSSSSSGSSMPVMPGGPQIQQHRPQPPPLPQRQPPAAAFSEDAISQLGALGFSRQEAIAALQATGGDVDLAASLLFN